MTKNPIYKDTYYTFSADDTRFRITVDGSSIYEGRSKAKPNGTNTININRICANYLKDTMEGINLTLLQSTVHLDAYKEFVLQTLTGNTWSTVETFGFLWDYDKYTAINFSTANTLSHPVNSHYRQGMYRYETVFTGSQVVTTPYSADTNNCGDYALIYRNLAGGWDSFLFEGKCKRLDDYSTSEMKKDYNNNNNEFGRYTYLNSITGRWELNSGYLKEDESKVFARHLVSSTECYLIDFANSEIVPVVITDKSTDYKRYLDNDNYLINYTLNIESSQNISVF
ncbi:MAG: hypothetical protein IJH39_04090 [Clostridia bacterium]|nr:hypothetical protein [Clostridia bacterium]